MMTGDTDLVDRVMSDYEKEGKSTVPQELLDKVETMLAPFSVWIEGKDNSLSESDLNKNGTEILIVW